MFHPFLKTIARQRAAREYAETNKIGILKALRAVRNVGDDEMNSFCAEAAMETGAIMPDVAVEAGGLAHFGAIGDGHILKAIMDWLKSPEGQAFISALIKLLLAALMAA